MALSAREKDDFRALLLSERTKILAKRKGHFRSAKEKIDIGIIRSAIGNHATEAIIGSTLVEESLSQDCIIKLEEIDEALKRLDADTYGICLALDCDLEIPVERLKLLPGAELCIACQKKKEAKENKCCRSQRLSSHPIYA